MTPAPATARRWPVVAALGVVQIIAWGSSFYLLTVLALPIARDTGWPLVAVTGALSAALLVAGLVSPRVGAAVARRGGRPVLAMGCATLAVGLLVVAAAPSLPIFVLGWLIMGLGMGASLYDPAFATLGRLYGRDARRAITALTLWGGFASTVSWPLSAALLEAVGWRGTAAAYAGGHLLVALPLVLLAIPPAAPRGEGEGGPPSPSPGAAPALDARERASFRLFAAMLVIAGVASVVLSVHLLTFLRAQGHALAAAVALGALFGPAQVGARVLEMASGGRHHPILTLGAAAVSTALGLVLLALDAALPGLALILFGAGSGLLSIARGALPLAVFGPERYAALMGRLARPNLLAQAVAPALGAAAIARLGPGPTLWALAGLGFANLALLALLWRRVGGPRGLEPM